MKILKMCTQGHYAPCSTGMFERLGMEDMTNNRNHFIDITFYERRITIAHIREETAGWGECTWHLVTTLPRNNLDVEPMFEWGIQQMFIKDTVTPKRREHVLSALSEYFKIERVPFLNTISEEGQKSLEELQLENPSFNELGAADHYLAFIHLLPEDQAQEIERLLDDMVNQI
eukprot:TRINITY_DN4531_c0_g2_i1.p1 TRINITY_DN4531_c0_g2~~TRINITY_DN4531_c0_g2_i1.p1  ORF type:complete len:173 (-),score=30.62 TRINITY_DN4531_c0_g2_i1:504-1022(-)